MKTALLAGATGLVGSFVLEELLRDSRYATVVALTRRPLAVRHTKLQNIITDFDRLDEQAGQLKADDVYCCLGTTIRKAGSRQAFCTVDHHYPLRLARLTLSQGATCFLLVSALGANPASRIFYNRVKGQAEEDLKKVGFTTLHIFRPSLLLGPRQEPRPGEDAAKWVYKIFGALIPRRYKAIHARAVAKAMLHHAHAGQPGVFIHESDEMQTFSS
jgi:uncharacterized protein YbjT (DUF2867 family)